MVYQAASNEQCNGQMGIPGLSCGLPPLQFQLGRHSCGHTAGAHTAANSPLWGSSEIVTGAMIYGHTGM